jgi:quercetin dioxygenase-like cupin family protein
MEQRPKQTTNKRPAVWFTGDVWIDPISQGESPSTLNIGAVHLTPGARTAWHSHQGGQTLYVTEGSGLIQSRGEQSVEIRPGDVIYTPTGEEHWHGATPQHFMTHLSVTEGAPQWAAHVADDEYQPDSP